MAIEAPQSPQKERLWRPSAIVIGLLALALPLYLSIRSNPSPLEISPETPPQVPLETRQIGDFVLRYNPNTGEFSVIPQESRDPGALVNTLAAADVITPPNGLLDCAIGIVDANPTHISPMGVPLLGPNSWEVKFDPGAIDVIPKEVCGPHMPVRSADLSQEPFAKAPRSERHPITDSINTALESLLEKAGEIHPLLRTYILYHITLLPLSVVLNFFNINTFKKLHNKLNIGFIYAQYGILSPLLIGVPTQIAMEAIIGTIEGPILSPFLALFSWIGLKNELDGSSINGIPISDAARAVGQGVNVAETLIEREAPLGQIASDTRAVVLSTINMSEMDSVQMQGANGIVGWSITQAVENLHNRQSEATADKLGRQFRTQEKATQIENIVSRAPKDAQDRLRKHLTTGRNQF